MLSRLRVKQVTRSSRYLGTGRINIKGNGKGSRAVIISPQGNSDDKLVEFFCLESEIMITLNICSYTEKLIVRSSKIDSRGI